MSFLDIDRETLSLAVRLQLEDLAELRDRKGKSREGERTDAELAVETYYNELAHQQQLLSDASMCLSVARAIGLDANAIGAIIMEERQATNDRAFAVRLHSGSCQDEDPSASEPSHTPVTSDEDANLDLLAALYISAPDDDDSQSVHGESSAWAASRLEFSGVTKRIHKIWKLECDSCGEQFNQEDIADCPCPHKYCRECLDNLVRASLSDESLFPPRCCREDIPLRSGFLSAELTGELQAKKLEFETPNRTYCHQPSCSTFIPRQFIDGDIATCIRCYQKTCVMCKGATHDGECPDDVEAQDMLQFAAENGWQRCYSCRRLVELFQGCNHMGKPHCSCPWLALSLTLSYSMPL
jgi:hypothetical protein